jgi:hypothetical protein
MRGKRIGGRLRFNSFAAHSFASNSGLVHGEGEEVLEPFLAEHVRSLA